MVSRKKRKRQKKTKSAKAKTSGNQPEKSVKKDIYSIDPDADFDTLASEIRRLMAAGKSKSALSLAKTVYKKLANDLAGDLLVEAYMSRISELVRKGYAEEASTLFDLAQDRYGFPKGFQVEMNATLSALTGDMEGLLQPLSNPAPGLDEKTAVHKAVKNHVWDLRTISRCKALAKDHSLRKDATALGRAFKVVTTEGCQEEMPSLSGISRKSPLASWKMLIGAIEAFYRFDDGPCDTLLNAVEPFSAPGRMVPVLRAMLAGDDRGPRGQSALSLMDQVLGNDHKLQKALTHLDGVMGYNSGAKFFAAINRAVNSCKANRPELVEKLKQHISVRCVDMQYPERKVENAMGGPPLKNAYYWRLSARERETANDRVEACASWEQFSIHAIHESLLPPRGPELSALYHHMARLLDEMPEEELTWERDEFKGWFEPLDQEYRGQPESIRDVVYKASRPVKNKFYYLFPETLYQLACRVDPVSENFSIWFSRTLKHHDSWKDIDPVAMAWHEAIPDDIRPLLYLTQSTEKRNALQKALGYLNKAESLDRLSPDVKRARKRLMVSIALRHLKQQKTHLARKDFQEMECLPQFSEESGLAFLTALKWVSALIDRNMDELAKLYDRLMPLCRGRAACHILLGGLFRVCGLKREGDRYLSGKGKTGFEDEAVATAFADACLLYREMGISLPVFWPCTEAVERYLRRKKTSMEPAAVRAMAETAIAHDELPLAYAASGVGLGRGGPGTARFLLLRAQSIPGWAIDRRIDCVNAVVALARRERNVELIEKAAEFRKGILAHGGLLRIVRGFDEDSSMDLTETEDVLNFEIENDAFPHDAYRSPERRPCGPDDDLDDDDEWDDDGEWDVAPDQAFFQAMGGMLEMEMPEDFMNELPREAIPILVEIIMKYGMDGDAPDLEEIRHRDPELMERFREVMGPALFSGFFDDIEDFGVGRGQNNQKRKKK